MNGLAQGYFEDGVARGREMERKLIVCNLLKEGFDYEFIKDVTSCDIEQIKEIAKNTNFIKKIKKE